MFETIVWATDGSELADRALVTVMDLARQHHATIVAIHANELLAGRFGGAPMLSDEPELVAKIRGQVTELRELGLPVELKVVNGTHDVAQLIAKAAREVDADLIVVGTHGWGGFRAAVLGSVARGLLHTAFCPVLSIPPETRVPATA
ncbi:MAG TPA: universal stress protein [Gaiellaceae bacterium]|jgi:nucleotide-binding universal stress UspA family protein